MDYIYRSRLNNSWQDLALGQLTGKYLGILISKHIIQSILIYFIYTNRNLVCSRTKDINTSNKEIKMCHKGVNFCFIKQIFHTQ